MNTTVGRLPLGARGGLAEWLAQAIAGVRRRIAAARHAREARALLLGMSDRDLRDIGLTRHEPHRLLGDGGL
jgi:uncharacterized protein YjiS (DUF1127 family)